MKITDYRGNVTRFALNPRNIDYMVVTILSGDEIVDITLKDGTTIHKDSSSNRVCDYGDGVYVVEGKYVQKWQSFIGSSYYRQLKFENFLEERKDYERC